MTAGTPPPATATTTKITVPRVTPPTRRPKRARLSPRGAAQHPDRRQTRDDDAHRDLEPGPDDHVGVVPGRVHRVPEAQDRPQPHAARDQDEEAQREHDHDAQPASPGDVEPAEQRERHDQDDDVLRDAGGGRGEAQRVDVEALVGPEQAALPPFPDEGDGQALQDLQGDEDEARERDPGGDGVAGPAEARVGEDAQVEAEDGGLCQGQDGQVECFGYVEELFCWGGWLVGGAREDVLVMGDEEKGKGEERGERHLQGQRQCLRSDSPDVDAKGRLGGHPAQNLEDDVQHRHGHHDEVVYLEARHGPPPRV